MAVAFSGGGDSLALLLIAKAWADRHGRRLTAFTVDHGLQRAARDWPRLCAERCARLGVPHETLVWSEAKPKTRLAAAARTARHDLLAEATRRAGARVILMAHTADDRLEAELMRQVGATTPSPRLWRPSPSWPAGLGMFILRPLLALRRQAIRDWLRGQDEAWIDDPANTDPKSPRARARSEISTMDMHDDADVDALPLIPVWWPDVRVGVAGEITLPLSALGAEGGRGLLAAAVLCASGRTRPPRNAALTNLIARLAAKPTARTTLAGAVIALDPERLTITRDMADDRRGPPRLEPLPGSPGLMIWDGRFGLRAPPGTRVVAARGLAARLSDAERGRLRQFPAAARGAVPVWQDDGGLRLPRLQEPGPERAFSVAQLRLAGAIGAIVNEAALADMAERLIPS